MMTFRKWLAIVALLALPAVAMADRLYPPCGSEPLETVPLSAAAVADVAAMMVGPLVHHGVSLLFLGSVAVVGLPWGIAFAVMGAAHFLRPRSSR